MSALVFTSRLAAAHHDALEQLLFFNEQQARSSEGVSFVVERYGKPRIQVDEEHLRIDLDSEIRAQSLFVLTRTRSGDRPIGVMVYTREEDALVVLFVAVDPQYSQRGELSDGRTLSRMVRQLESIALRVRGIERLVVYAGRPKPIRIRLEREPP